MIDALWGWIAGAGGILAALVVAYWRGRSGARDRADRQAARDYRDTRKEIDNADLGHGASDAERIRRLREIANRRGSGGAD